MFLFAGEMDCSGPAEPPMTAWEQVAVECVLTAPDGGAPLSGAGVLQPVSQACAEAMGEAIAMDWESFDETPRAFTTAVTPAEIVIGGALVAAGTQGFTVGAALDEQAPATMAAAGAPFDPLAVEGVRLVRHDGALEETCTALAAGEGAEVYDAAVSMTDQLPLDAARSAAGEPFDGFGEGERWLVALLGEDRQGPPLALFEVGTE